MNDDKPAGPWREMLESVGLDLMLHAAAEAAAERLEAELQTEMERRVNCFENELRVLRDSASSESNYREVLAKLDAKFDALQWAAGNTSCETYRKLKRYSDAAYAAAWILSDALFETDEGV